mmetsp:Transcript_36004/g.58030  ORF Transcript_36004/g.58030 Transcript_36004/m.58030 type:complete len:375 (+) Transcript_36004:13-1137(+)
MSLKLPQGQKLLTNVSVVRMKKGKEKYEIATYPNTIIAWRTGAEKDVREVLQIDRVFRSVEQGEYAKSKDLVKSFGTEDQAAVCLEILNSGEMQLSEKERGSQQETLLKEICTMVAERCINSQSKRPVTVGVVERALAELHFNVDRNKNAKKQALEAIKLLESKYPIERLPMHLKITFPLAVSTEVREKVANIGATVDREDSSGGVYVIVCKISPDKFRDIDAVVRSYQADGALLELLQIASEHQGDAAIDSLAGLSLNSDSSATHSTSQHSPSQPAAQPGAPADSSIKAATAPGMVFASRQELAAHMKSDWHKHNLTLKSSGKPLMTKEQFVDFKIMAEDGVSMDSIGGGGKGGGKGGGGKKGKNKKEVALWD